MGQVFVAWADARRVERWLALLPESVRGDMREQMLVSLAQVRERGYSISRMTPHQDELAAAVEELAWRPNDEHRRAAMAALIPRHAEAYVMVPGRLPQDIATIATPVFGAEGEVAMALSLYGVPQATPDDVDDIVRQMLEVSRQVTRELGGRLPDRSGTPRFN
jgi:DNA-binding IclR family transcriptional regulator